MILPVRGTTTATSDATSCGVYPTLAPKGLIISHVFLLFFFLRFFIPLRGETEIFVLIEFN